MTRRVRRLVPLLLLAALVVGAAWLLRGEGQNAASNAASREEEDLPSAARLVGAPDAADRAPDAEDVGGAARRPARWHLGFRVEAPNGSPHPFAKAWLVNEEGQVARNLDPEPGATEGRFTLSGACRLVVEATGFPPWTSGRLIPTETSRCDVVVRLEPALSLQGRVFRPDGSTPDHKARVTVECIPRAGLFLRPGPFLHAHVDPDGRFAFDDLPPGRVRITVRTHALVGRRTTVVADAGDQNVRIVLIPVDATRRLDVSIENLDPEHATGDTRFAVYVTADGEETLWMQRWLMGHEEPHDSLWLGYYSAAPGSTVRFRVVALGYEQTQLYEVQVPLDEGPHPVRLALRSIPDHVAHLTIHLVTSGRPSPRFVTGLCKHPSTPIPFERRVVNDRIALRLPPGRCQLTVSTAWDADEKGGLDGALVGDMEIELTPGERTEVDLPLRHGGLVFLVGLPDAWIPTFTLARGEETITRMAEALERKDEEGYAMGPVPPGRWTLTYDGTNARRSCEVVVRAGEITTVHHGDLEKTPRSR